MSEIEEANLQFDTIVAITKWGLIPAYYLAQRLKINKIDVLCVSSYTNDNKQTAIIDYNKRDHLSNYDVSTTLVVDDINDTGNTLSHINNIYNFEHYVTLIKRKSSGFEAMCGEEIDGNEWIIFPREVKQVSPKIFKNEVVVRLSIEWLHCWPTCEIEEVYYLRNPHRHMFHIEAIKSVTHNDREVEIIMLKRGIENFLTLKYRNTEFKLCVFEAMSCEDIAQEILLEFDLSSCQVLEDNENWGRASLY